MFLEGDHSLSGGRSPKTGRAARRTCHAERASAGRRWLWPFGVGRIPKIDEERKPVKRKQEGVAGCESLKIDFEAVRGTSSCQAAPLGLVAAADIRDRGSWAHYRSEKRLVSIEPDLPEADVRTTPEPSLRRGSLFDGPMSRTPNRFSRNFRFVRH